MKDASPKHVGPVWSRHNKGLFYFLTQNRADILWKCIAAILGKNTGLTITLLRQFHKIT